jgi:hypothetical protein
MPRNIRGREEKAPTLAYSHHLFDDHDAFKSGAGFLIAEIDGFLVYGANIAPFSDYHVATF